ncbi:MAG: hypothetical protein IKB65_05905 [Ruminiclostridium sp.]|nr:hypothetical protein [Ruminiclostridium sp.]
MDKKYLIHAMGSIAWGYVFFYLAINLGTIDILPDWVLFVMVVRALEPLSEVVHSAKLLDPLGILLGVLYGFQWLFKVVGHPIQWYLFTVIVSVLVLYFNFQLLTNLAEVARKYGYPEEKKILQLRTVQAILTTVAAIPLPWEEVGYLYFGLAIVHLVVVAWICVVLFSLRKKMSLAYDAPAEE